MKNLNIITELERYIKTDNRAILEKLLDDLNREYKLEELKKQAVQAPLNAKKLLKNY